MYIAPRPLADDDPLFPIRVALMPVLGFVLGMAFRSPLASMYPVMMFSLIAANRKAFNLGVALAGPLVFGAMIWIMGGLVVTLQGVPDILIGVLAVFYFLAFYMIQRTGNPIGMLILMVGVMVSIMGFTSYQALDMLRDELTKVALCTAILTPILYALLPPATTEKHVTVAIPAFDYGWATRAAIRTVVLLGYSMFLYTVIDSSNMMIAIAGVFVLCHSSARSVWEEASWRSFSVLVGGGLALSVLGILQMVGHLEVLVCLVFLAVLWMGQRMMTGHLYYRIYQDAASVMLGLVGSALATSEPGYAFIQRAGLTIVGTIVAAIAVSLLDALFVKPDATPAFET